ncbi:MAG: ISL3 family transposase [Chloroflexi bacterium]|nr:ISL3 family transposase [Chloroflexota bacterium]
MSTSLLYHGFGIRGYQYVKADFEGGKVIFTVRQEVGDLRCGACGSRHVVRRGVYLRRFRSLPIGGRPVQVLLDVPRVGCMDCGAVRQVPVRFADGRRSYTKAFERHVLDLSRHMTIQDVARHLQVGWDVVKDIQKRYLGKKFGHIKLKRLRQIAIDEIAIGRGHRYLTVVLDLASGAVVFVGDGKGADALKPFWKRLKASHAKVKAVAMDMSPAYIGAVLTHLPKAVLVFDHFHIIKLFNEKLSGLRRDLYREATEKLHKDVLKGTRWLLLKNPENLDDTRDEPRRLREALKLNEPLATAYYMKDDLRRVWEQRDKQAARRVLMAWIRRAETSGIRMLIKFAHTLAGHRNQILAYYDYPISTGPLEGTNTKIRVLQHQAYGFRDTEFFKLKIYALHETRYELVGGLVN